MERDDKLNAAIAALPTPSCPLPAGEKCSGKFERVVSCCRPGEVDVSVRCECQAVAHYVLDEVEGSGFRVQGSEDEHDVARLNADFHGPIETNHEGHEDGDQSPRE